MATSKAQIKSNERYRKRSLKLMQLAFSPHERDIYAFVQSKDNKAGYVKKLIRQAMNEAIECGEFTPPIEN